MEPNSPQLIATEDEAATLLRLSPRTLQRLRVEGDGPSFVQLTGRRVGYAVAALEDWIKSRSVRSTSAASITARKQGAR